MNQTMLSHFNGANGDTSYTAESSQVATFAGASSLSNTQTKFGATSLGLSGAAGNYITFPDSTDWQFGTGNFTIDFWVYVNETIGTTARCFLAYGGSSLTAYNLTTGIKWSVILQTNKYLMFQYTASDGTLKSLQAPSGLSNSFGGGWHHICLTVYNAQLYWFVDGVSLGGVSNITLGFGVPSGTQYLYVGQAVSGGTSASNFKGWIDEFRIKKGEAIYITAFTPYTYEYPLTAEDHFYINAESVTQDGQTSATGYHNFTALRTAKGEMIDWTVDVVATTTSVVDTNIYCRGTIRPYVVGSFPVVDMSSASYTILLNSNTTFSGIRVKCHIDINNSLFQAAQADTTAIVIDSCFIDNVGTIDTLWVSGFASFWGTNRCSSLTIKNCTLWGIHGVGMTMPTWVAGQQLVFVNNSIVQKASFNGFITSSNVQCWIYNIAVKGVLNQVSTSGSTNGAIDYFKTSQASYTIATGTITIGSNNTFSIHPMNLFPADNVSNKDFTLSNYSRLINTGVTNSYTPSTDILGNAIYGGIKDVGAYEYQSDVPATFEFYINADSVTQDGLTPSTGYNNFTNLIAAKGELFSNFIVDVVSATASVVDAASFTLCGLIRPYVAGTFPVIAPSGAFNIGVKSNTTITGLRFIYSVSTGSTFVVPTVEVFATNVVITSCKFENTTVNNMVLVSSAAGTQEFRSLTVTDCTLWRVFRCILLCTNWATGQDFIFANNSIIGGPNDGDASRSSGVRVKNVHLFCYNNAFKATVSGFAYWFAVVDAGSQPTGVNVLDYFYYDPSSLFGVGGPTTGEITTGTHRGAKTINMFPAIQPANNAPAIAAANKDFALTASSQLIDIGITNAYTPTVDILGKGTYGLKDVGAYEYVPTCWSFTAKYKNTDKMFKLEGTDNRHPRNVSVPSNIDMSSICMLEHGRFVPSTEYKVL